MWKTAVSVETEATPEQIWRVLTDWPNWGTWDSNVLKAELNGPLAAGGEIIVTVNKEHTGRLRLTEVVEGKKLSDVVNTEGGLVIRTERCICRADAERMRVTFVLEIEGPDEVTTEVGPAVTADWPGSLKRLATAAEAA